MKLSRRQFIQAALVISALSSRLDRRMAFALSISDRELFVSIGADTLTGQVVRRAIV